MLSSPPRRAQSASPGTPTPPPPLAIFAAAVAASLAGWARGRERRAFAAHAHWGTAREPGLARVSAGAPAGSDADGPAAALCVRAIAEKPPQLSVRRLEQFVVDWPL